VKIMFVENFGLAITALLSNKMRTFLTMLGIIIGIASVIAIMTVSDAMSNSVMSQMGSAGANTIEVFLTQKYDEEDDDDSDEVRSLKESDYFSDTLLDDIKTKYADRIKGVSLQSEVGSVKISDGKKYANVQILGVNDTASDSLNLKLVAGRKLQTSDFDDSKKVALVSDRYVSNIYGGNSEKALGNTLEAVIDNKYYTYTIVGVYKYVEESGSFSSGTSQKDVRTSVYIPYSTAVMQTRTSGKTTSFDVIAQSTNDAESLATELQTYINEKYYANNDAYESYAYSMQSEIAQTKSMLSTQKNAFMAIGAIALLVGGIGVMNIMIVSITERTREIGTRKALGATNGMIRLQFITEAATICLIGGILGTIAGLIFGAVATKVMGYSGSASITGILFCIAFSLLFGVFFGYYPAAKAAKLNPIEALRYE